MENLRFALSVALSKEKVNIADVIRYVRPAQLDINVGEVVSSPCGGITFKFKIFQDTNTLVYWYAVCRDDDTFDFEIAREIIEGRAIKHDPLEINTYNRSAGLVENVVSDLEFKLASVGSMFKPDQELVHLHSKLKKMLNRNEKIAADFAKLKSAILGNQDTTDR